MLQRWWFATPLVVIFAFVGCLSAVTLFTPLRLQAQVQVTAQNNLQVDSPALRQAEPPWINATAAELEKQGDELRSKKAELDALDYYRAALRKTKAADQAVLLNKVGIVEMNLHHYGESQKSFERSIKANKKLPESNNNLGVIHYLNKDYAGAIRHYRRAIVLDPGSASFYNNLGAAFFEDKDFKRASAAYHTALELDPDLFERTSQTGVAFHLTSPQDRAHYFYVIAQMYAKLGQADRALLYLRKSLEDGYRDINQVYKDEEFALVRKTPEFTSLMTTSRPVSIQQ